jgi:pyruvate-formate lyase-activating enzyme
MATSAGSARSAALPVDRSALAPLERYARLVTADGEKLAGYVEATRGCSHLCRHCPVPVVYHGRTRVVELDDLLADVAVQVTAGARHITFGDPDFLNRPRHALRVASAVHSAWPELTFDVTVKIEHILRHPQIWPELAAAGCLFVVSAVESVDDEVLRLLDKGHTTADTLQAIDMVRSAGIELRPSLLPFTPWTTLEGFVELVRFVGENDLVDSVDPVQFGIRLLLPPGSLLLEDPDPVLEASLTGYDQAALSWTWRCADERVDRLQAVVAGLAEQAAAAGDPLHRTYAEISQAAYAAVGRPDPAPRAGLDEDPDLRPVRPHLSESWFCCAEPTGLQLAQMTTR